MSKIKKSFLAFLLLIGLALLAACGPDAVAENKEADGDQTSEETSKETQDEAATELSGDVVLDGSSTVFPIAEAVAEEYKYEQPGVKVSVSVSGTGGGFERFIAGETDISNASRPIKDEEAEALNDAGVEFTEFEIAYDGLSVVVNKDNDWVDNLTIDELKKMWIHSDTPVKWSDIREGWPEEEIKFYSPGTDSGTFDYFNEVVLDDEPIQQSATLSEDDNVLVTGVVGDVNAIGYFGYAYYAENTDTLKVVPIVNPETGEAVEPNSDTIESGEYSPLSRPLFIYVKNDAVKEKPQVYDFVKFFLENAGELAGDVGYVNLPQDKYDTALEVLEGLK